MLDRHGLPRIDLARCLAIFDFHIRVYYERVHNPIGKTALRVDDLASGDLKLSGYFAGKPSEN